MAHHGTRRSLAVCVCMLGALQGALVEGRMPSGPFVTSINGLGVPVNDWPTSDESVSAMMYHSLADVDPLAVCNDGSPAGYYMAPGTGAGASLWLVYLEGSMFCWSEASCKERLQTHPYWMSSLKWADSMEQGGIFATDGSSGWGTANRVFVKYCTSDFWSGDAGASAATWGFQFRGSRVVAAVITDLLESQGMGATPGQRLLFGGCSAGAIGAMNNIDAVQALVGDTLDYRNLLDGAALLDIQPSGWPWSSDLETLQSLMASLANFSSPVFPAYCAENFPGEEWKCLIGQYRMPLLSTSFFINAPQFDMFELMYDTDNHAPATPAQYAFVDEFQSGTQALIAALPAGTGVFSATCLAHCLSGQPTFTQFRVNGVSMSEALNSWYFDTGAEALQVVSACSGWQCTAACGVNTATGQPCNGGTTDCVPVALTTPSASSDTSTDTSTSEPEAPPAPGWPPAPPTAPPRPPSPPMPTVTSDMSDAQVDSIEASLTPGQLKMLKQAQCAAAAQTTQEKAQEEQHTDSSAAAVTQAAGQAALAACLSEAADSATSRRLLSAVPSCCYGRGDV